MLGMWDATAECGMRQQVAQLVTPAGDSSRLRRSSENTVNGSVNESEIHLRQVRQEDAGRWTRLALRGEWGDVLIGTGRGLLRSHRRLASIPWLKGPEQ